MSNKLSGNFHITLNDKSKAEDMLEEIYEVLQKHSDGDWEVNDVNFE